MQGGNGSGAERVAERRVNRGWAKKGKEGCMWGRTRGRGWQGKKRYMEESYRGDMEERYGGDRYRVKRLGR